MARTGTERVEVHALVERLCCRREEIEQTLLTRIHAISDPKEAGDPEYALGLREAVAAGVSYALAAIGAREDRLAPIPPELSVQARRAARLGVSLDTVLRRYVAAHTLLDDFIAQEAEAVGLSRDSTTRLLRVQAVLLDRLIDGVAGEHSAESEARPRTTRQRQAECVRRLLAGELADTRALDYDLDPWHLGIAATGVASEPRAAVLREIGSALDRRLLIVHTDEGPSWAWLGGGRKLCREPLQRLDSIGLPAGISVAIGEPARGLQGWRLTHHQAMAALPMARGSSSIIRYSEVGVLASLLRDDVLVASLHDMYLTPLAEERDGGEVLRQTLRAYFTAERNSSSAAAALGVSRQTVKNRLRTVERRIERPLSVHATGLETALRLERLKSKARLSENSMVAIS